jgi:hypothetical protein
LHSLTYDNIVFNNSPIIEYKLKEQGFIKINIFPEDVLKKLKDIILEKTANQQIEFYNLSGIYNIAIKKYFYELITNAFSPFIEVSLNGYSIVRISVIIKGIHGFSSCNIHTDDNYLDENRSTPLNIWTPLVSTNETNGGLNIIPKSHHYASKIRGFGIPQYYHAYQNELMKYGIFQPTEFGESIAYNPGILHFSRENNSGILRPAIVIGIAPKNTEPIVYFGEKKWFKRKVYTMKMSLDDYIYWDEKTILKDKITDIIDYQKIPVDIRSYKNLLTLLQKETAC